MHYLGSTILFPLTAFLAVLKLPAHPQLIVMFIPLFIIAIILLLNFQSVMSPPFLLLRSPGFFIPPNFVSPQVKLALAHCPLLKDREGGLCK